MRLDFPNYCHNVSSNYFIKKSWLYMTLKMPILSFYCSSLLLWSINKRHENTKDKIHKLMFFFFLKDHPFNRNLRLMLVQNLYLGVFVRLVAPFIIELKPLILLQHLCFKLLLIFNQHFLAIKVSLWWLYATLEDKFPK